MKVTDVPEIEDGLNIIHKTEATIDPDHKESCTIRNPTFQVQLQGKIILSEYKLASSMNEIIVSDLLARRVISASWNYYFLYDKKFLYFYFF